VIDKNDPCTARSERCHRRYHQAQTMHQMNIATVGNCQQRATTWQRRQRARQQPMGDDAIPLRSMSQHRASQSRAKTRRAGPRRNSRLCFECIRCTTVVKQLATVDTAISRRRTQWPNPLRRCRRNDVQLAPSSAQHVAVRRDKPTSRIGVTGRIRRSDDAHAVR
jgi:hypothetical protein